MRDAWRLAVGTLTALPTPPPRDVTRGTARTAMMLAPFAVLPLGIAVASLLLLGDLAELPPLATGFVAVGAVALMSRCLHWDGVSDVADGLTASYDAERSLAVMKTGTSGPAGTVAVVILVGLQASALAAYTTEWQDGIVAGALVCLSRCALWIACAAPPVRTDGLGVGYAGTVSRPVAGLGILLLGVLPGLIVAGLVRRCVRRLGGVTGDVFGAAIEVALAGMLVVGAVLV